jgi:hypothetical protein
MRHSLDKNTVQGNYKKPAKQKTGEREKTLHNIWRHLPPTAYAAQLRESENNRVAGNATGGMIEVDNFMDKNMPSPNPPLERVRIERS